MCSPPSVLVDLFRIQPDGERIMFLPAVWPVVMDCDDADTTVHPDAGETCGNGRDDDCDGAAVGCGVGGTMSLDAFEAGRMTSSGDRVCSSDDKVSPAEKLVNLRQRGGPTRGVVRQRLFRTEAQLRQALR